MKIGILCKDERFIASINSIDLLKKEKYDVYYDLEIFKSNTNKISYDIVLIDFDTSESIGFEITTLKYFYGSTIVFATSQPLINYKQAMLSNNHIHFVYKPDLQYEFSSIIESIKLKVSKSIVIKENRDVYKLYFSEIYIVYSEGHYVYFVLRNRITIKSRTKINEYVQQLELNDFVILTGKLYANVLHIKNICYEDSIIYFDDGSHQQFSRSHYKTILQRLLEAV